MNKGRFAIVIPVYNHEEKVASVIEKALTLKMPTFVVDDGSTDGSLARIRGICGISLLEHDHNMGKGAALLTGFHAASEVADWAITIDADGQHHPEDALNMIAAIPPGKRPIVLGRREGMMASDVPWSSRFGRKFSNFWVHTSGGPVVSDSQSGMRIYPLPETLNLSVKARRFQFEVEILVRAKWKGMDVVEAPVNVTYEPREIRVSHYRGFIDFMRNSATFSRLICMRIFIPPSRRAR